MFFFLFAIKAFSEEGDEPEEEMSNVKTILTGKWRAEIARTDASGNHDETEDEGVEVRFSGWRRGKVIKMGVYTDSTKSADMIYNATLTWDQDGSKVNVTSEDFNAEVEFFLLTKYEARGTVGNIRYLFEITDNNNAQATITDTDTNEKTEITLFKEQPFFDPNTDWKVAILSSIFMFAFISVACFCKSPEGKKIEEEEIKKYEMEREQKKKEKEEKSKKRQEHADARRQLDETL